MTEKPTTTDFSNEPDEEERLAKEMEAYIDDIGGDAFQLSQEQVEILAVKLKFPKLSNSAIARGMGIDRKKVDRAVQNPVFIREHRRYFMETSQSMRLAAQRASARVLELIDHPNPTIALRASNIALAPWVNQQKITVEVKPHIIFRTNVDASGSLVREVIEGEIHLNGQEDHDDVRPSSKDASDPLGGKTS